MQTVRAYEEALPDVGSVVDTLSHTFEGKALTLSASADYQTAAALGAHRILMETHSNWDNHVFSWNSTLKNVVPVSSSPAEDLFDFSKVAERIASLSGSSFSKGRPEDIQFLAEMEILNLFIENLESHPSVADQIPDSFNFGISSLRALLGRYNAESDLIQTALSLVDETLVKLVNKLETVYGNKFSFQLIVQPPTAYQVLSKYHGLHEKIDFVPTNRLNSEFFPVLYGPNAEKACPYIQQAAGDSYLVSCHQNHPSVFQPVNGHLYASRDEQAGNFQLYLWTAVVLILAVYAAVYATATMDIGIDSTLYRATTMKDPVKLD